MSVSVWFFIYMYMSVNKEFLKQEARWLHHSIENNKEPEANEATFMMNLKKM